MTPSGPLKAQSKWEFKVSQVPRGLEDSVSTYPKSRPVDNVYEVLFLVKDKAWSLESVPNTFFVFLTLTALHTKKNIHAVSFEQNVLNHVSAGLASGVGMVWSHSLPLSIMLCSH